MKTLIYLIWRRRMRLQCRGKENLNKLNLWLSVLRSWGREGRETTWNRNNYGWNIITESAMFLRCQRSFRKIVNPCFDVRKPYVGLKNLLVYEWSLFRDYVDKMVVSHPLLFCRSTSDADGSQGLSTCTELRLRISMVSCFCTRTVPSWRGSIYSVQLSLVCLNAFSHPSLLCLRTLTYYHFLPFFT